MSSLRVTSLKGRTGSESPTLPDGAVVTGVCTATSFDGNVSSTTVSATTVSATTVSATTVNATTYVGVPPGFTELDAALFN